MFCSASMGRGSAWTEEDWTRLGHYLADCDSVGTVVAKTGCYFMSWPPASPDLNPMDWWCWGRMKGNIKETCSRPEVLAETGRCAEHLRANFDGVKLARSMQTRVESCIHANGGQF